MIPAYLSDLHLDEVFAAYTSNVDACLLSSSADEHVVDSESAKVSRFVTATFGQTEELMQKYFEVKNPSGTPYCLLQIDNGAIPATAPTKRCDCGIMNAGKLSLVEFKANAVSTKSKTLKKNYKYAMKQLKTTIALFNTGLNALGLNFTGLRQVDAFVCFRRGYPRLTTSEMNYIVDFARETGGIPLSFTPSMTL